MRAGRDHVLRSIGVSSIYPYRRTWRALLRPMELEQSEHLELEERVVRAKAHVQVGQQRHEGKARCSRVRLSLGTRIFTGQISNFQLNALVKIVDT